MVGSLPWLNYVTITNPEAIEPFAEFGIILLLFSIGLELSFRRLWGMRQLVFGARRGSNCSVSAALHRRRPAHARPGLDRRARRSALALACPRPRWCCRWSGTTSPVGRAALAMLLFEDLAHRADHLRARRAAPHAGSRGAGGPVRRRLWMGALVVVAMLVLGRFVLPRAVRAGGADQEPRAVPRRSACWW